MFGYLANTSQTANNARRKVLFFALFAALTVCISVGISPSAFAATYNFSFMDSSPTSQSQINLLATAGHDSLELGIKASTNLSGSITSVRFYKDVANVGIHTADIWDASGTKIATQDFTNETASGWQEVSLTQPVSIPAGSTFTVSVFSPNYYYSDAAFPTTTSGPLTLAQSVYIYSSTPAFPGQSNGSHSGIGSNYGVDFVFNATPIDYPCGTSGSFQVIGAEAVGNNSCTGNVTIPEGITSIAVNGFAYSQVSSVTLPSTLTTIGINAFQNSQLSALNIPGAVTSIGAGAFTANSITSLLIPSSVQTIGDNAFSSNPLTSLTLPGTAIQMGSFVFKGSSLTSLIIPSGTTRIYQDEFSGDPSLTSVTLPAGLTTIDRGAFYGDGLTAVVIPDSVNSIGPFAFDMASLKTVSYCGNDSSITIYPFANSTVTSTCSHPKITINSVSIAGTVGSAISLVTVTNTGGPTSGFTVSPNLPAGIVLDSSLGTISGTPTAISSSSTYTVTATGTDQSTSTAQLTISVAAIPQTISFTSAAPTNAVVGGSTYSLAASGGLSGNPITFTVTTPLICSNTSGIVSFTAFGTCTIDADQSGNSSYLSATKVSQSFNVGKGNQSQIILMTVSGYQGLPLTLNVSGGSGTGTISFAVTSAGTSHCSISSTNILNASSIGTCSVTATKAGDTNYAVGNSLDTTVTFTVDPAVIAAQQAAALAAQQAAQQAAALAAQQAAADKAAADKAAADKAAADKAAADKAAADKAAADKAAADKAAADKAAADKAAADKAAADKAAADKAAADKAAADKAAADKAAADKAAADKAAADKAAAQKAAAQKAAAQKAAAQKAAAQKAAADKAAVSPTPSESPVTQSVIETATPSGAPSASPSTSPTNSTKTPVKTTAVKTGKQSATVKLSGLKIGSRISIYIKTGAKK
jgi:hypothetical protein